MPSSCRAPLDVCRAPPVAPVVGEPATTPVLDIGARDVMLDGVRVAKTVDVLRSVDGLEKALGRREPVPTFQAPGRIVVRVQANVDAQVLNRVIEICTAARYVELAFAPTK